MQVKQKVQVHNGNGEIVTHGVILKVEEDSPRRVWLGKGTGEIFPDVFHEKDGSFVGESSFRISPLQV